ncbi:MAG: type II secretion system protein GspG, partial [Planctomycetota bacterium]
VRTRLLDEADINKIREEYELMGQLEKETKQREKEEKKREIEERTEEMMEDEERLLNLSATRWEQEGQEIRRRGEEAGLDADAIDFEVASTIKCRREMFMLLMALESYHARHEKYPDIKEGLDPLYRKGPDEMPPILLFRSVDPWGGDYQYGIADGRPVVRSFGADRKPGGMGIDDDLEMSLQR